jgi:tRNA A37 threonylcarbamoyladenosine synthetase subunit TsaC/SUA5/YrdC
MAGMMRFTVGENQPIIGERSFTCTTGIHQDNFDHLGHTTFRPEMAGREWTVALNRHSSRKSVQTFLSNHPVLIEENDSAPGAREALVDAIYSYLSYQVDVMDEDAVISFCDQLREAHTVLRNQGVLICPTTVGYTLVTTQNIAGMKSLKGRPENKPCGILGNTDVYRATFGADPPLKSDRFDQHIVGYLGQPETTQSVPSDAVGPGGEVGIWLDCGPVVEYLAARLWSESKTVLVATSCNRAGDGNPESNEYDLSAIDSRIRAKADYEVGIQHWETPELDDGGRWLSAPIWDIDNGGFVRTGRDQDAVASLLEPTKEETEAPPGGIRKIPNIKVPTPQTNSTIVLK